MQKIMMWSLRILYTFVLRAEKCYHISNCVDTFPYIIEKYTKFVNFTGLYFTKYVIIVIMSQPNSNVCLIGKWSVEFGCDFKFTSRIFEHSVS